MPDNFENTRGETPLSAQQNKIGLPLIALGLGLVPVFFALLTACGMDFSGLFFLAAVICAVTGFIIGIHLFSREKKRKMSTRKILVLISVILPALYAAFIVVGFMGVIVSLAVLGGM
jgi:hypothetical protein